VETAVELVVGAGGVRAALKGGLAILKNPGGFLKGTWTALKQDVGSLIKPKANGVNAARGGSIHAGGSPVAAHAPTVPGAPPPAPAVVSPHAQTYASASGQVARDASARSAAYGEQLQAYNKILQTQKDRFRPAQIIMVREGPHLKWAFEAADKIWANVKNNLRGGK
jgi:hypothetical protein